MTPEQLEERLLEIEAQQVVLAATQTALFVVLSTAAPAPSKTVPVPPPLLPEFAAEFVQQRRAAVFRKLEQLETKHPGKAARLLALIQATSLPELEPEE